jgi:type IV pilus assembly protein PilB
MSVETAAELPPGLTAPPSRGRSRMLIGELLVELGFATPEQVHRAVEAGRATGRAIGRVLLDEDAITPDQLARALALRLGLHHVDLASFPVDMAAANLLDPAVARRHEAVPIGWLDGEQRTLIVAMADPGNVLALDDIGLLTGYEVMPAIATPPDVAGLVVRLNRIEDAAEAIEAEQLEETGPVVEIDDLDATDDAPVVRFVNALLAQAVEQGASDIHIAPNAGELRGQFRIDGVLSDAFVAPPRMAPHVISRLKLMADVDIAERRVPQDGRFAISVAGRSVDIRVVTLPLVGGESVVMRILDRGMGGVGLDVLGMFGRERSRIEAAIARPYGAVLVTGPTGSGKTTTLYAALHTLNTGDRSIMTLEDPVEYRVEGIKQMQVNAKAGITFANGLRSMMRADPDVVLVGEIRDHDTARIAIEAALTGHLVLSTLHTNDAPTAITRLTEMGVEPFLVSSAIECIVAQRLARRLCTNCRREVRLSADALRANGFPADADVDVFEPGGCGRCNQTGYRGRIGVYEVMRISDAIRAHALACAPASTIAATAVGEGMRRLRDDAFEKVLAGLTSATEAARVTVAA